MKSFGLIAVLLVSSACLSQSISQYPLARADRNVVQLPSPLPTWGGANGAGAKWCNPEFNGLCIIRITDANTNQGSSLTTADTGDVQLVTKDSRHIAVRTPGRASIIRTFDPVTQAVGDTPLKFLYIVQPSETDSQVLYGLKKTAIHKLTANAAWTAVTDEIVYDYANDKCLGASYVPTWTGVFTIAGDPQVFRTAFSNSGAQGSGNLVVAYSEQNGCSVLDTVAGTVTNNGVLVGSVDTPDRFRIHSGGIGRNPLYASTNPTIHQPDGSDGCLTAKKCATQYFWQIGTTHLALCGPPGATWYCDGHLGELFSGAVSGHNYRFHGWYDPAEPLTSMGSLPEGGGDTHQSPTNGADINGQPLFIFSQIVNSPSTYTVWGVNEIMAMALDGSGTVIRFGQNLNSGKSSNFVCQNAIGTAFQSDGAPAPYALFTSDMGGTGQLGYEADGATPRCDVFAIETTKNEITVAQGETGLQASQ